MLTRLFRNILDNLNEAVVIIDDKFQLIYSNKLAEQILGKAIVNIPPEQWCEYYDFFLPNRLYLCPPEKNPILLALKGERLENAEFSIQKPLANASAIELTASPLYDDQLHIEAALIVFQDVTKRKNAEIQQRAALVREVHHRIKNNLQGITGVLTMAINDGENHADNPLKKAISQVQSISIIHGLQGQTLTNKVYLIEMVSAITTELQKYWNQKVKLQIGNIPDFAISEDEAVPIALVFNEIISNAIKHGRQYGPIVLLMDASQIATETEDYYVEVSVRNFSQLPENFDFEKEHTDSSGLELIKILLPQNGAKLSWQQRDQQVMTTFVLSSPIIYL